MFRNIVRTTEAPPSRIPGMKVSIAAIAEA